jgi:hypothetical protein
LLLFEAEDKEKTPSRGLVCSVSFALVERYGLYPIFSELSMNHVEVIPFPSPSVNQNSPEVVKLASVTLEVEGEWFIDSLKLASQDGRSHKDMLRTIKIAIQDLPEQISRRVAAPTTYIDSHNRTQPKILLSKEGLFLLFPHMKNSKALLLMAAIQLDKLVKDKSKKEALRLEQVNKTVVRLEEKLKKRDNPESGETIPNYPIDENGKTTREILFMKNLTRIERLDAMLSNCRVQEIGRAKQVAKLEWMKRDTEKGVIEPCKYYRLKSVYSPRLDEDCRD